MIVAIYTPSSNGSANFIIGSPALGVIIFLFLFAILTGEAHLIFTREAEPLSVVISS